jgi:hypothetical protein
MNQSNQCCWRKKQQTNKQYLQVFQGTARTPTRRLLTATETPTRRWISISISWTYTEFPLYNYQFAPIRNSLLISPAQQQQRCYHQKNKDSVFSMTIIMLMLLFTYPFDFLSFLILRKQKDAYFEMILQLGRWVLVNWICILLQKWKLFNPTYPFSVFLLWLFFLFGDVIVLWNDGWRTTE